MRIGEEFHTLKTSGLMRYMLAHGVMVWWLKHWIPNPGVPSSKPLGGSKVDSAFHSSQGCQNEYQEFLGT